MKTDITIIIPCYNCQDTLREAVESCFVQNLRNFEIVMVDDCSTDKTKEVMQTLAKEKPQIKLFYHDSNRGGGAARNTAVQHAQSDFIFCLDGDDILPKNVLSRMLTYIQEKKCDGVLFEETKFFSGSDTSKTESLKNTKLGEVVVFEDMFKKGLGFLAKVNFLYTKNAHTVAGGYPTHHGFDTQAFGYRFLSKGLSVYVCPDTFYYHRRHNNPSYFVREYQNGKLSINTYLMFEDFFFLFSDHIKKKILSFDIIKNKRLNKKSLENVIVSEYQKNPSIFFISDYKKYLTSRGELDYIHDNNLSTSPLEVFTRAIYIEKHGDISSARKLYSSLGEQYSSSKILNLKIDKRVVLLMHNGGRLGNQLWWMVAFYAYCLEKGYIFDIRCFFEYQEYFTIKIESFWAKLFGKLFFITEKTGLSEEILRDSFYMVYNFWFRIFFIFVKKRTISDSEDMIGNNSFKSFLYALYKPLQRIIKNIYVHLFNIKEKEDNLYYSVRPLTFTLLPPSGNDPISFSEKSGYFYGWLFRNPNGIMKYKKEIKDFFTPKKDIDLKITDYTNSLRMSYKYVIGVHVRLGDAVNEFINKDRVAYSEGEVVTILKEYLVFSGYKQQDTCFIICSDGVINESVFEGFNIRVTHNNPVEDLWLLSKTDTIIGADSSFAVVASLFGDIPFIVFKRGIDWDYYKDKKNFFVNKYIMRFKY